ncbi:XRE family transcriptional regulator [Nocardiopsis rhodophaea]|uniref:XRE family transcriptional regulator n=1 Tax=Nocardiopsis rhodophaea TaxID=280238 RepID=A0ABN2S6W6_9ACTN
MTDRTGRDGCGEYDPCSRRETRNTVRGSADAIVQAEAIHGGVHVTAAAHASQSTPRQLPMTPAGFVNRAAELSRLDELLSAPEGGVPEGTATSVVISAIGGAPGIGKTALAVHWAHRVRSRFDDGDLYVNMRGYGPGAHLDASEALGSLLQALGVPPESVPLDLDGRAALFRSKLDRKRVLIVIDDVVSAEQVRPLLPASPGCMVLVTSRSALPGLVAREGARRMTLSTLGAEEALALLRSAVGADRIDAEPDAARSLVAHCAHLPLALRILAERLISRPDASLRSMAEGLAAEDRRLEALGTSDDELSDVRAVFSASYTALAPDSARLFRCLGLHPGGDFGSAACAAAAGLTPREGAPLLEQLVGANMLQRIGDDRYRLHDLLRLYAVERIQEEERGEERDRALRRSVTWYLGGVRNAVRAVMPNFRSVDIPAGEPLTVDPCEFDSATAALDWFEGERTNIVAAVRMTLEQGLFELAWRLPVAAYPLFEMHRHLEEWKQIHLWGLAAARSLGDRRGEARNLLGLGDAEWLRGDLATALDHYAATLTANQSLGDGWIEGFALRQTGLIRWEQVRDGNAPALLRRAIDAFRCAGERRGEGMALLSLAECERSLGNIDQALEHCDTARAIFTEIADTWSIAWSGCSTASVLASARRHPEAVAEYRAAVEVFQGLQDRSSESVALIGTGESFFALGDMAQARMHLGAALDILRSADDPRADEIEAKIARMR